MKKIIIFGVGNIAELAHFYFTNDSNYEVSGFVVDKEYMEENTFCNLPVVETGNVDTVFPPSEFDAFVAISYSKINEVRKDKYNLLKSKGYSFASYVSSKATCYAREIGDNSFILEDNTIQPFVKIGCNVTLWSGNHIGHHSVIQDHCFISSHVVISGGCQIGEKTFIGVNATLRDHVMIGESNVIGAGALLLADTNDQAVFVAKGTEMSKVPSSRLRRI